MPEIPSSPSFQSMSRGIQKGAYGRISISVYICKTVFLCKCIELILIRREHTRVFTTMRQIVPLQNLFAPLTYLTKNSINSKPHAGFLKNAGHAQTRL